MRDLSNTTGSDGYGEISGETGDSSTSSQGKAFYQELIGKANTVPIIRLFKHYGIRLDERNKAICPIPTHKGGRENSASFNYYPHTNTFWCFGCKTGVGCCDLAAAMERISKAKAAFKIIEWFREDVDEDGAFSREDFSEQLEIMMDFSNVVREFRQSHFDENAHAFIEHICLVYDDLHARQHAQHKNFDNEALRRVVELLKVKISYYKPCPKL